MAWKQAIGSFMRSTPMLSMIGGVLATGVYVGYKDYSRYYRMIGVYKSGNILAPLEENHFEISYFGRPVEEKLIRHVLSNEFSNEYYLINGEVGTGKTRMIIELVREMMTSSRRINGAPIYVLASQGASFPETLAAAVKFYFDEHISFNFFLNYVLRIESFPRRDEAGKLTRVLDAIEESAFLYMLREGRPVVLVIDGLDELRRQMPGAIEKIQDKAKLWADTNIVKVVFVNNDEETEEVLQRNSSSWSRCAMPIMIDDLTKAEAVDFLTRQQLWEKEEGLKRIMTHEQANWVVNMAGGRLIHLLTFKRNFVLGLSMELIADGLKDREREKFIHVSRQPSAWNAVSALRISESFFAII